MVAQLEICPPSTIDIIESHLNNFESRVESSHKHAFIKVLREHTQESSLREYKGREKLGDGHFIVGQGDGMILSLKERNPEKEHCQLTLSIYKDMDSLIAELVPSARFFIDNNGELIPWINQNNNLLYGEEYTKKIDEIAEKISELEEEKIIRA